MSLKPLGSTNAIATVDFKNSFVKFLLHDNHIHVYEPTPWICTVSI